MYGLGGSFYDFRHGPQKGNETVVKNSLTTALLLNLCGKAGIIFYPAILSRLSIILPVGQLYGTCLIRINDNSRLARGLWAEQNSD